MNQYNLSFNKPWYVYLLLTVYSDNAITLWGRVHNTKVNINIRIPVILRRVLGRILPTPC